jgi:muconate cycloisomerase
MVIQSIKIYNLKIPFARTIKHSLFTRNVTESIIVVLKDNDGNQGFGEGTPREYVTGESLNESLKAAHKISKKILGQPFETEEELNSLMKVAGNSDVVNKNPAAFCALETGLLDLWSRLSKKSIYQLFNRKCREENLFYSGVIPSANDKDEFLKYVHLIKKLELPSLKIKVADAEIGISQLKMIRETLGQEIDIRVDANAAFTADTAIQFIKNAKSVNLSAIEQPVPKNDLVGLKEVSRHSEVPIIADESMYTSKGPFHLIDNDICHGLNIRLSSCGGFRRACQIYDKAILKKMMVVLGAHVGETAVLSFAGRNLAMICKDASYLEGSFSKYIIKEDLVDHDIAFGSGGIVPVPYKFGLGVEIKHKMIEKWSQLFASLSVMDDNS